MVLRTNSTHSFLLTKLTGLYLVANVLCDAGSEFLIDIQLPSIATNTVYYKGTLHKFTLVCKHNPHPTHTKMTVFVSVDMTITVFHNMILLFGR